MKRITQIMLVIVSAIILTLSSACGTIDATDDAQHVAKLAAKIADFDLPAGYAPEFSAEMLGYTLAAYKGESGPSHLYFIQSENEADGKELERMLTQLAPGSSDPNTRLTVIENRTTTVRGQEVTLVVSEGTNSEKVAYRQVTAGFQGKGGPAILVLSESVDLWDQASVDAFLQSIQ
jgi:hypothetical protein